MRVSPPPPPPPVVFGPPEIQPQDIRYDPDKDKIGDGQYGIVYKGICRNLPVAVKKPHRQVLAPAQLESFRHEVKMMSQISHPNVVRFMGACTEEGKLQIVTERCKTNLESLLQSNTPLTMHERMRMARDAALGMTWLHETMMIHRDLKSPNLLVDFSNRVKVADLGFTQIREKPTDLLQEPKGTLVWMAPEIIFGEKYNEKVDVYSFGIILWEILTREKPYAEYSDPQAFVNDICYRNLRPTVPASAPPLLRDLIVRCWDSDPNLRCSFSEIVQLLSQIIVDCVIDDLDAALFWKKYFLETAGDLEKVEWSVFENNLSTEIQFNRDGFFFYLMSLLAVDDHGKETEFVTMQRFCKIVKWFGPFFDSQNGKNIIAGINDLMQQSWFHGDISSIEANSRLARQPSGSFLIRFSRSDDAKTTPFTISNNDRHVRIERVPQGFKVQGRMYRSLGELVEGNRSLLRLACPQIIPEDYGEDAPAPPAAGLNSST